MAATQTQPVSVNPIPTQESRPVPDPTVLTNQQIVAAERNAEAKIECVKEIIETRLAGMDKAIELLQAATYKVPESIKSAVLDLQELHTEKFDSIATQFAERDKRTEQLSVADKTAIAAALQAQKEAAAAQNESNATANDKTEKNFKDQIATISTLITAQGKSADDKNEAVKMLMLSESKANSDKLQALEKRLDIKEGQSKGIGDVWAILMAIIMALIASGALLALVLKK